MTEIPVESVPPLRLGFCQVFGVRAGGLAHVYLCQRSIDPSPVAVKRLREDIARAPQASGMFVDECRVWLRLPRHPNVVAAVSAHAAPPEPPMVVLEYVPQSLRDLLRSGPLTLSTVLSIARDVCFGMEHLRSTYDGFVHLDLKPENVLITEDGTAKVTDFGLAKVQATAMSDSRSTTLAGTPAYMAPEQCLLLPTSISTDVYAFGCVLTEMATQARPFPDARTADDYLHSHVHERPTLLTDRPMAPGLLTVLDDCLQKDPARRPQSFGEVRLSLERIAEAALVTLRPAPVAEAVPDDQQLAYAQGLANIGAREEARQIAESVLASTQENAGQLWAITLIARTHNDDGNPQLASTYLERGGDVHEGVGPVIVGAYWNELARVATTRERATELYRKALEFVPEASVGWWNLAVTQVQMGAVDEAIASAREALKHSRDLRYYTGLTTILREGNRLHEALEVAQQAVTDHPAAVEAWAEFAYALVDQTGIEVDRDRLALDLYRLRQTFAADDEQEWRIRVEELLDRLMDERNE